MSAPRVSSVTFSVSVVTVTVGVGAAAATGVAAAGTPCGDTAVPAEAVVADGTGTALAGAPTGAIAVAAGRVDGPKKEGCPLCLFQASHRKNKDIVNTTHRTVRRISVMGPSRLGAGRQRNRKKDERQGCPLAEQKAIR